MKIESLFVKKLFLAYEIYNYFLPSSQLMISKIILVTNEDLKITSFKNFIFCFTILKVKSFYFQFISIVFILFNYGKQLIF